MSILKKAGLSLAALLCASTSGVALANDQAIIITDYSDGLGLRDRLIAAGYNVTITGNVADVSGDLSSYKQVWDMRVMSAMGSGETQSYMTYLNNAGGLFLLGENANFAPERNASIVDFIVAAGGGSVVYGGTSTTSQYVTSIFNGNGTVMPDDATNFYVPLAGTFSSAGNGVFITTTGANGAGQGTGIAFGTGALANAMTGRLMTYLDVDTFDSYQYISTPALQNLIDRMISFVGGQFTVPPAGPTIIDRSQASFDLDSSAAGGATITFNGGTLDLTGGIDPNHVVNADIDIQTDGAFINTAGNSGTFAGALGGNGGLIVGGGGTLALTHANTYTGGTIISDSSTVEIGASDALGTGGVVLMGGRLRTTSATSLDQSVTLMSGVNAIDTGANMVGISGTISGTGGFVKTGTGTLTLTGTNSYTGGTIVQAGTLVGDSNSLTGAVLNNGNVVFNQGSTGVYDGAMSGTGSFTKQGAGSLNLTGTSSYSGNTVIEGGRLAINGSVANSQVAVNAGGTVGGNGVVGGLIVHTNGTAAPGNSIGQLHAATTVLFEPSSTYQVEVNAAGQSDKIAATGVATLQGGTVQVLAATGTYRPQTRYEILTASQVTGKFANVTSNLAFLMPTLDYSANNVTLVLTRNDVSFLDVAATANQRATATAINAAFAPTSDLYYAILAQSAQGAQASFDHLSGEVHASALSVAARDGDALRRSILDRLAMPSQQGLSMWTELAGEWSTLQGGFNTARVTSNTRGFRAGIEQNYGSIRIGVAGGYNDSDLKIAARSSHGDVNSAHAAVYGGATFGNVAFSAGASYSWLNLKTDRTAGTSQLSQRLTAKYDGRIVQAFGEAGYKLPTSSGTLEPFVGVNALWLKNDAFAEQGGSLALRGNDESRTRVWSTAGVKMQLDLSESTPVSLAIKGAWQHALTGHSVNSTVAFLSGGPAFSIAGAPLARDAALVDAGLNWQATKAVKLGVSYSGTLADKNEAHAAKAMLSVNF